MVHPPKPVHSSPWSAEEGAAGPLAIQASHTPVSAFSYFFEDGRGHIPEALSIRERPAEVEDRAIPGRPTCAEAAQGPDLSCVSGKVPYST
jgi:hypothetical protein